MIYDKHLWIIRSDKVLLLFRAMNVLKTFIKTKTYPVQKKWKRFNDEIQCLKTRVLVYAKKVRNLVSCFLVWPLGFGQS